MAKLIIFGNEKMAEMAHFYFTHDSNHEIVAFTVNRDYIKAPEFKGLPVVPFEDIENLYPPHTYSMFVAVGYKKLNKIREAKYLEAKKKGYSIVSYLCSKASVWGDTKIGENCFILENQVIQPNVTIGNNVMLWSGNHFGHDVVIGDNTYLASHIVVSGNVTIGKNCFIGINASFKDHITIGNECIIGAGAIILRNIPDKAVYIPKMTELFRLDSEGFEKLMGV
jgi:sugar O-acyltransferase (sialic acid O-acetyltransferase NeuD family)